MSYFVSRAVTYKTIAYDYSPMSYIQRRFDETECI